MCGIGGIKPIHIPKVNFHGVAICHQCSQPACEEICPAGAIKKSETDGVVRIEEEKCVGCALCTLACPYGGVDYSSARNKAFKCDTCGGEPKCVDACKHGVLSFMKSRSVYGALCQEDPFVPGVAMCSGCAAELAIRFAMRIIGEEALLFTSPGCAPLLVGRFERVAVTPMTNVASIMTGVKRYSRKMGRDVVTVAFTGDGAAADVGFQSLSGAAERGENIIYICYDNEAYMNTGIQRSSTTPFRAWTNTTPLGKIRQGKQQPPKYLPLIMAFHGIAYTATATVAYLDDMAQKIAKAKEVKDGMSYIHLFCPCPTGWRFPTASSIEVARKAVQTNYFPLWEAEKGKFRLTHQTRSSKPIEEFTKLMGRFSHLTEEDIEDLQEMVNSRFATIKGLADL
jgi:phenylglyoxylate dehydrogenase beta subunit